MIPVDFKKYLSSNLRNTKWGDLVQTIQSILSDCKDEKIDLIIDQFDKTKMTEVDFQNFIEMLGWQLTSADGWTSEIEYLLREAVTILPRIKYKTTRAAYLQEYYNFNLWGDVYPLQYSQDSGSLTPVLDFWTFSEYSVAINILDSGDDNVLYYTYDSGGTKIPVYGPIKSSGFVDAYLDSPGTITSLDETSLVDNIKRSILLNYRFKLTENETEFLSTNSMRAFKNDINQIKRKTERIYYEPIVTINYTPTSGTVCTTTYELMDRVGTTTQETTFFSNNFSNLLRIDLGTGTQINPILGVSQRNQTILASELETSSTGNTWYMRKKLVEFGEVYDFSEVALIDIYSGCFLYSKLPSVNYLSGELNSNIHFEFVSSI